MLVCSMKHLILMKNIWFGFKFLVSLLIMVISLLLVISMRSFFLMKNGVKNLLTFKKRYLKIFMDDFGALDITAKDPKFIWTNKKSNKSRINKKN